VKRSAEKTESQRGRKREGEYGTTDEKKKKTRERSVPGPIRKLETGSPP